jgi:electron transfer flavoprotein beta subunit
MDQRLKRYLVGILQGLGVTLIDGYKSIKVEEPANRKGGVMVASVAELMDKLKNEAKVL